MKFQNVYPWKAFMIFSNNQYNREDNIEELLNSGFLAFTQRYPENITPFRFCLRDRMKCQVLDSGVLLIEPLVKYKESKDIILSCGIHGNETAPIELINRIVGDIFNSELSVKHRLLFIIDHPQATINQSRFIYENLNRLFNDHNHRNSIEEKRAIQIKQYVHDFFINANHHRIHYDLHTAIRSSVYPQFVIYAYQDGKAFNQQALSIFKESGIKTVLLSHQKSGTFSYFTSHHFNTDAFTLELGKVKLFGENDFSEIEAFYVHLKRLISHECLSFPKYDLSDYCVFQVKHELIKKSEKFTLNIEKNSYNFQTFPQSYKVTNDIDGGYTTSEQGETIVFPNLNVPVGQRAGLIVTQVVTQAVSI